MPPALRRSVSSPAVRIAAAPYPSSSSHSATRTRTVVGRRRGASDAHSRRVLADIEWWRVMQGQREENEHDEQQDEEQGDQQDDAADVDDARRPARLLYTLREDSSTTLGHSRGNSDLSSDDDPLLSTDSTPPRAPSLPLLPLGTGPLRRSSSSSLPPTIFAPTSIFAPPPTAVPPSTTTAHTNATTSIFMPSSLSLTYIDAADLDVGIYTAAAPHGQRHRHRAASFPGMFASADPVCPQDRAPTAV